jgi:hypothetical protein
MAGTAVFVTALYRIYGVERPEYCDEVWERFSFLARYLPSIHVFCSLADASRLSAIPNVIPHYLEFMELDTYAALSDARDLPENRNPIKDSKEFMILINAKPEFLRRVRDATNGSATHYIWIDAGIQKILHIHPSDVITRFVARTARLSSRAAMILLPGLHPIQQSPTLIDIGREVLWRFCGGILIVPSELVELFATETLRCAQELKRVTGKLTWEGNLWAHIEACMPIRWYGCGWNESMFDFPVE